MLFTVKRFAAAITGAIVIALIYLFIDGIASQAWELTWHPRTILLAGAFLVPIVAETLIALHFILRRGDDKSLSRIALAVLLFSLVCRLLWISAFDSYQVNDFGFYLNCGADVALSGKPSDSLFCGPEIGYVYWKRAAFYTYPIALLFGKSLLAVKLVNVLLATITAWLFFQTGKIILGSKVSAIGLLFFVWHPDLWYAMTLASHDFPGLFWLSVFFYVCALLQRRLLNPSRSYTPLLALSVCAGGAIFFLEVARSYHYGAILALALYVVIHVFLLLTAREGKTNEVALFLLRRYSPDTPTRLRLRTAALHTALLLVIPLIAYVTASRLFWRSFGVRLEPDDAGLTCYLSSMDVFGESRYEEIDNWLTQCPLIYDSERKAFATRKVLLDVTYDPREFLGHLARKNRVLSRADDYLNWATSTEHESWDTTYTQVRHTNQTHLAEQEMVIYLAHAAFLLLVSWRLLLYPALRVRLLEAIPILFSAVYYAMFLFLLETQSRYELFLIFVFPWMAAQAVIDLHHRVAGKSAAESTPEKTSRVIVYFGGAAFLVLAGCLFWGVSHLAADSFLTLRDQSDFFESPRQEVISLVGAAPRVAPDFITNDHKRLILAYPTGIAAEPGSVMAVQRTFRIKGTGEHHLRFFLSTSEVRIEPFDLKVPWDDTAIEYIVAVNGRRIASGKLSDFGGNGYFSFDTRSGLEFVPKMTIQLILRNVTRIARVDANRGPIVALEYIDLR